MFTLHIVHFYMYVYISPRKELSLIYDNLWYNLLIVYLLFKALCLLREKIICKYQMTVMS